MESFDVPTVSDNSVDSQATTQPPVPTPERLTDADMLEIERANNKRQLAVANAKNATLEAEAAEMGYKNLIMSLFLKHGLTQQDTVNNDGTILRRSQQKDNV